MLPDREGRFKATIGEHGIDETGPNNLAIAYRPGRRRRHHQMHELLHLCSAGAVHQGSEQTPQNGGCRDQGGADHRCFARPSGSAGSAERRVTRHR